MTTELRDDLINFSFDDLHDVFKNNQIHNPNSDHTIFYFVPLFLECLKKLVWCHCHFCVLYIFMHSMIQPLSEADHIHHTQVQVHFDRMLCNILEKYHSFPGFTLLLGSLCQYVSAKQPYRLGARIVASSYLTRQRGEGRILDDTGLFGAYTIISQHQDIYLLPGAQELFSYLTRFLENPDRSGPSFFDQQRYTTAAKECLQLYLCSHHNFSKGATEFAHRYEALRRNKPSIWISRLGVHSRIRTGRHHFKFLRLQSIKARGILCQHDSFPENSPGHEYFRFLSYRWALHLLPFFLERSAISLELANVLRSCTFAMMAWKLPRRRRLAKKAIAKYLLRVESTVGGP